MNEIHWLKSLNSPEPVIAPVDVSRDVMRSLSRNLQPAADRATLWVWSVAALLGLSASTAAGALAFTLWQSANDPAQALAAAWSSVLQ